MQKTTYDMIIILSLTVAVNDKALYFRTKDTEGLRSTISLNYRNGTLSIRGTVGPANKRHVPFS